MGKAVSFLCGFRNRNLQHSNILQNVGMLCEGRRSVVEFQTYPQIKTPTTGSGSIFTARCCGDGQLIQIVEEYDDRHGDGNYEEKDVTGFERNSASAGEDFEEYGGEQR